MKEPLEKGFEEYTVDQIEIEYIRRVLTKVGPNQSKAAEILALERKALYR